jgi:dethiobiotin synthetase
MRKIKLPPNHLWGRGDKPNTARFEDFMEHNNKRYFITGIGTDIGKTVAAAILTEALEADYWKPIQSGATTDSDKLTVQSLISNTKSVFHAEVYSLTEPLSPHAAAELDGVEIVLENIIAPQTNNTLLIEGAGGLMVPLNYKGLMVIDLIKHLEAQAILVSRNYLGSINHTLLSAEALKARNIPVAGIIINGAENPATERVIFDYTGLPFLGRINEESLVTQEVVLGYKQVFQNQFTP